MPSRGMVVLMRGLPCVVTSINIEGGRTIVVGRLLKSDGLDDLGNDLDFFVTRREGLQDLELKVIDRMYYHGESKPFQIDPIDYEPLMLTGKSRHNYSDRLPEDNPLRSLPFWGSPGGKNLTIIACLEWALMHLQNENGKLSCGENVSSIQHLKQAISLQKLRQESRQKQGVLGTDKAHVWDTSKIELINQSPR